MNGAWVAVRAGSGGQFVAEAPDGDDVVGFMGRGLEPAQDRPDSRHELMPPIPLDNG